MRGQPVKEITKKNRCVRVTDPDIQLIKDKGFKSLQLFLDEKIKALKKEKFVKTLSLLALILLVSCGKPSSDSNVTISAVTTFEKNWTTNHSTLQSNYVMFDSVDLTDMNNILFVNVDRNGVHDNCVMAGVKNEYNIIMGTIDMTYVSGDAFICSQLVGSFGYEAAYDSSKGYEYFNFFGLQMR